MNPLPNPPDPSYSVRKNIHLHPLWESRPPALPRLDIELTERCNNACQHCYINLPEASQAARQRELTTAHWQDIIRQAAGLGALTVRFTGGEPLLRQDFAELYLFTRQLGVKVLLFTNARLVTPELARLFQRVPPLEKIEITVYGMHPASYDAAACSPGAYHQFRRGVDLLLEYQVPFIVKGALLPSNQDETHEFEAWAAALPWMDKPPSYARTFYLRGRPGHPAKNQHIQSLRLTPEDYVRLLPRGQADYQDEMHQFCTRFMGPPGSQLFSCGAGKSLSVDAYGLCQPCLLLRDPALCCDLHPGGLRHGSLRHGSLRHALETFFPTLAAIQAQNPAYRQRCARCFLHGLCEQCPAHSWSEHGNLDTPVEYLCQLAHAQALDLGLLAPNERAWEVENWRARVAAWSQKYNQQPAAGEEVSNP